MPLCSPADGPKDNVVFWLRAFLSLVIMLMCWLQQVRCCLPWVSISHPIGLLISVVSTGIGTAFLYGVALTIGYPVPFNLVVEGIPVIPFFVFSLHIIWRQILEENPVFQMQKRQYLIALSGEISMTWVYPVYLFVFLLLGSRGQSAFACVLPLLKLGFKIWIGRSLHHVADMKPTFLTFNVDVFGGLYLASCLQTAQSRLTTLVVMVVDVCQLAYAIHRVSLVLHDGDEGTPSASLLDAFATHSLVIEDHDIVDSIAPQSGSIRVMPVEPSTHSTHSLTVSSEESGHHHKARRIRRALYLTEVVLLSEFAEVMIPIMYSIYLEAMSQLPNRLYYPRLAALSTNDLRSSVENVLLNAVLELMSFLSACGFLKRKLGFSTLHMLAFTLETQRVIIHASLIMWTLYVTHQALEHYGVDFTFQFAWLPSA